MQRSTWMGMCLLVAMSGRAVAGPLPAEGVWREASGTLISIQPCGNACCGSIAKIVVPSDALQAGETVKGAAPTTFKDVRKKDASKRDRSILGLTILTLHGDGERLRGQVYNPEDGRTYSGTVTMHGPDRLELRGCIGSTELCRSEMWTRVR